MIEFKKSYDKNMSEILIAENISKQFYVKSSRPSSLALTFIDLLKGLHDRGRFFWALRDVSFSVEHGCTLGIIGHNGAGKSTLLRLLCGVGRPTSGRIIRKGISGSLLALGTGFHGDLTGRENLMTGGILSGLKKSQVMAKEDEIISFAELEDFIDQPVRTYSSGMYLRLAFATAIHLDPDFLILDEALSVGDSRFQQKCFEYLHSFRSTGKSIILVSHELEQVRNLCDEILVLEEGRIAMQGSPESAIRCYNDLMRQRTERRAAEISGGSLSTNHIVEHGSRIGTQEAAISTVHLYNEKEQPADSLFSGESLIIELEYIINTNVPDVAIVLGIYNAHDIKCFESTVHSAHEAFGNLDKHGRLRCHLSSLPLLSGLYYINVGLYPIDWNCIYDYHWQMHALHVINKNSSSQSVTGIISVSPSWFVENKKIIGNTR